MEKFRGNLVQFELSDERIETDRIQSGDLGREKRSNADLLASRLQIPCFFSVRTKLSQGQNIDAILVVIGDGCSATSE